MTLRILHFEDNPDDVVLVRRALARHGLECDIHDVSSERAYLAALAERQFDVIISDSGLPGYDGQAALAVAQERCPGVPFIVLSGHPQLPDSADSLGAQGAAAAVSKSDLDGLATTIRRVMKANISDTQQARALQYEAQSINAASQLEERVAERTAELERRCGELEAAHRELETFCHSVVHDLRSPLITVQGFSEELLEGFGPTLGGLGRDHLERIVTATHRMHRLIDDLLGLSTVIQAPLERGRVDLSDLCGTIMQQLRSQEPDRACEFVVAPGVTAEGDPALLRIALEHLLSNAWKFTSRRNPARIEFGSRVDSEHGVVHFVRDNGAGFDSRFCDKLFSPLQRLHAKTDFPGNGIGLTIVQRVVRRHGGSIWAESAVDQGATFHFTLASSG